MAIGLVTVLLTLGGFLIKLRLPGALDLLNPKRLIGVNQMVFDGIFMLRDRWPELSDAAVSIGAIGAFSALGCAVLHALSRRIARASSVSLLLLLFVTLPDGASALDLRKDVDTHIAAAETIDETLVCTGDVVSVEGTIDGDLVVAAERFTLRGTVTGNLFFFSGEVEIEGTVEGTIIGVGERIDLAGRVDGATTLAGDRIAIADGAELGRDVTLFGEGVRFSGKAARDVTFAGDWIEMRAEVGRDLQILWADRVELLDGARITGDVHGRLIGRSAEIDQAPEAIVGGEVELSRQSMVRDHYLEHYKHAGFYVMILIAASAAFLFGLLLYLIDPRVFEADPPNAREFVRSLGMGFVVLLAAPVAIVLVGLTVVGVPIAILGLFILLAALYSSFVIVAGLVGRAVYAPSGPGLGSFAPSLLVGILILATTTALPFVGPAVRILATLFGLGCLLERARGLHALNATPLRS